MTDDRMALIELTENGADGDLVREMLAFAERLMEAEVEARTGAGHGDRDAGRPDLHPPTPLRAAAVQDARRAPP